MNLEQFFSDEKSHGEEVWWCLQNMSVCNSTELKKGQGGKCSTFCKNLKI